MLYYEVACPPRRRFNAFVVFTQRLVNHAFNYFFNEQFDCGYSCFNIFAEKKCQELEVPFYGSMNCSTDSFDFETVCEFECQRGYVLIGSRKRTCLSIALWDGLPALCRLVQCTTLSPPANGYMVNADCGVVFNAACGFRCNPGYRLIGNSIRVCQQNGAWSGGDPVCESELTPFFCIFRSQVLELRRAES